jgi:hypothetical protein
MNKANLKSYAPKARLDFIAAITARANLLGISVGGALPADVSGDVVIIEGREWPAKLSAQRDELIARIKRRGFEQTMDEVAYTWFNRFAALRFMEIHEYLDHGWRVLSSRDGGLPEILRHGSEVSLPGLDVDRVRGMQLAGNQDDELYKLLLVAQCNELSRSMPFLFERIDDETELLLPENLLRTDSIVAKLVAAVPEGDWQQIEVIGWLYQFYISEKKDEVIGKVVKSEDIPAATQLFTPNWIVQYMVQNSVGRLWLMANLTSTLAKAWPYYIPPVEQTPEVQAQLDALIQARIREDGETLNPESITVLDPACGSGHILVVAYDVLKAIYLERGYQPRSIPRLILEKNLYGLDIDDRAAQLAAFALLMKARADDRRLLNHTPKLHVFSLRESKGLALDEVATHLATFGMQRAHLKVLFDTFEHARTFGSLIQIPPALSNQLEAMMAILREAERNGDLYARQAAADVLPLVWQALVLGMQFDAVVANPPYMGTNGMNKQLKDFARVNLPRSRADLFAMFLERGFFWCKAAGINSLVTMQGWMFLSSYYDIRKHILNERTIASLIHIGYNSFPELNSKIAQACAFSIHAAALVNAAGRYINLNSESQSADKGELFLQKIESGRHDVQQHRFQKIPGEPIAFWISERLRDSFTVGSRLGNLYPARRGLSTGNNDRFIRFWHEISISDFATEGSGNAALLSEKRWFPYNKGGAFRKWYGNNELVVNWFRDGFDIKNQEERANGDRGWRATSSDYYFQDGITWGGLTSSDISFRWSDYGAIFDTNKGPMIFAGKDNYLLLGFLSSNLLPLYSDLLNPTLSIQNADIDNLPVLWEKFKREEVERIVVSAIEIARADWNLLETAWGFKSLDWASADVRSRSISIGWQMYRDKLEMAFQEMRRLEENNNELFIAAYGLESELSPEVSEDQVTLIRADREKDCQRLISYVIGCMMGRYSLDEPGLIYAHAGNVGFGANRYVKFRADADGIVPIADEHWFEHDAGSRVIEFLRTVWGAETLEANLAWLAEGLGTKGSETPDDSIRRYLANKFFKDHLQTYKNRPIYWLFSSGKHGAFQALVYLHRYHEGSLARLRAEYVVPVIAKVFARIEMLERDAGTASSAAARTKIQKQIELLRKKQIELLAYDEKLRHYADMRIVLDLDDGVKVNYGKFGELLAETKAVTGGSDE